MVPLRARDTRARLGRRRQLLAAASARLDASGYATTTMSEIAAAAGLAKGTTYLYFRSKESLFLELLLDAVDEWSRAVENVLEAAREEGGGGSLRLDARALALALAATVAARPRMVRLLALRHPVLEGGLDAESAERFERRWSGLLEPLAARLEALAAPFPSGSGLRLLMTLQALAAGLAGLLDRELNRRQAHAAESHSSAAAGDFSAELARCLEALLRAEQGPAAPGPTPPAP